MIVQISVALGVLCYVLAAGLFLVEAWPHSKRQSLFIVFIPGYIMYYALVNSARELPFRLLLMISILLTVVVPAAAKIFQRTGVQ